MSAVNSDAPCCSLRLHLALEPTAACSAGMNCRGARDKSQAGADMKRKRIPEIDFWRGFALIVILVDHVPRNGLDHLTPKNFGFSDAAEAFIFLSGVSVSLAYAPTLEKTGFGGLVKRCATRAAKLYLVCIAMVACSIAIPLAVAKIVGDQGIVLGQGIYRFVNAPVSSLLGAATLTYLPNYSSILALYIVLMLWAPVVIFLASRSPASALLASIVVYVAGRGRVGGDVEGWYFNPFAWQLVFAVGIICALRWRNGLPRPQGRLVVLALAIILGAAILSIRSMGLRAAVLAYLDLDKPDLGIMRLTHFLALAYVMSSVAVVEPWATHTSRIVGSGVGQSFRGMGRKSLLFFALGSVASAVGRSLMAAAHSSGAPYLSVHLIGLVYTAAAVIVMLAATNRMHRTAESPGLSTENGIGRAVPMNSLGLAEDEDASIP